MSEFIAHIKAVLDATEAKKQLEQLTKSKQEVKIDVDVNTEQANKKIDEVSNKKKKTKIDVEVDDAALDKLGKKTDKIRNEKVKIDTSVSGAESVDKVSKSFDSAKKSADGFGNSIKGFAKFGAYLNVFQMIEKGAKQAVQAVKEFDSAIVDLQGATGDSYSNVKNLMSSYNEFGKQLGATTTEISSGADSWLRSGRNMAETNKLIKDSIVLSKVAQIDSKDSSQVLTATLNGYKLAADQASHVNDVLTSIDLASASDAGGIGQSLTKTASMANIAGVSLEKTAAMIATIKDVTTESDESIGQGVKSILSRMNQIKAGKFIDDETGESLNDTEKVLKKLGITMRDTNGQFIESEDILDSVGQKFQAFDGNAQKAVATAMGGTQQVNKLVAMFDNWDKVKSLTNIANNSEGTAQKKFEEGYLNSIEEKQKSLQASFESLATNTFSRDSVSGVMEATQALVEFLDKTNLVKGALAGLAVGGAIKGFTALATGITQTAIKMQNFQNALDLLKAGDIGESGMEKLVALTDGLSKSQLNAVISSAELTTAQRMQILTSTGMSEAQASASLATMGLSAAEGAATASTLSLGTAMKGLFATLLANPLIVIGTGVTAGIAMWQSYKQSIADTLEAGKEATAQIKENNKVYQSNATWVKENADRYAELAKGVKNGSNLSLTTEEFEEYHSIANQIGEKFPDLIQGYDSLGNAILNCGSNVESLNDALANQKTDILAENLSKASEVVKEFNEYSKDAPGLFGEAQIGAKKDALEQALEGINSDGHVTVGEGKGYIDTKSLDAVLEDAGIEKGFWEDYDTVISKNKDNLSKYLSTMESDVNGYADGMRELASAFMESNKTFTTLPEGLQQNLKSVANSLSFDFFDKEQFKTQFGLEDWVNSVLTQTKNDKSVSDAFDGIFTISTDDYSANARVEIDKYFNIVKNALGMNSDEVTGLKKDMGFDDNQLAASWTAARNNIEKELGKDSLADKNITEWINGLNANQLDIVAEFDLEGTEKVDELNDKLLGVQATTKDLETLTSNVNSAISGYSSITTALSELSSQGVITEDTLTTLKSSLGDVSGLYEYTANGIVINNDALKELADNAANASLAEVEMREAMAVVDYQEKTGELKKYTDAHKGLEDALKTGTLKEYAESVKDTSDALSDIEISKIQDLFNDSSSLANDINGYDQLEMQIRSATSALNDWLRAKETANASDNMQTARGGLEEARTNYDNGWITKDDYTTYMDYIGNRNPMLEDGSNANYARDAEAVMARAERYLTEDASGVHNFLNDLIANEVQGVEGTDSANIEFTPELNMDALGEQMNMTTDFVTDMFLAAKDAGYNIDFTSLTEGMVDGLKGIDESSVDARTDLESFKNQISKLKEAGVDVSELETIYKETADRINGNPINFDVTTASAEQLNQKALEASESLSKIAQENGVDFSYNADIEVDSDNPSAGIQNIKDQLSELQEFRDTNLTVNTEEFSQANILIAQTVAQLQEAQKPVIMDIDTGDLGEKGAQVVELLQQFQELQNQKELQLALNPEFDSSQIDQQIEDTRAKLAGLNDDDSTKIKGALEIDDSSIDNLKSSIQEKIKGTTADVTAKITKIENPDGTSATININGDNADVKAKANEAKAYAEGLAPKMEIKGDNQPAKNSANSAKTYAESLNPQIPIGGETSGVSSAISTALAGPFSISVTANVSGLPSGGSNEKVGHASGTLSQAFASGTAYNVINAIPSYAGGKVSLGKNERALVNEMGTEGLIRQGQLYEIPGGMHMENLKKGDIILSVSQMKALSLTGKAAGKGKAYANGSVDNVRDLLSSYSSYASGSTGVTGGARYAKLPANYQYSPTYDVAPTYDPEPIQETAQAVETTAEATEDALKALADYFDWISVNMDRLSRQSELAERAIETAVGLTAKQAKTSEAMRKTQAELNAAKDGANRYLDHAQWYASESGLSSDMQTKVQTGTIDIEKLDDDTKTKVQEYQNYYEKYLELLDKAVDLQEKEVDLAQKRLENITDYYDLVTDLQNSLVDANDAQLDFIDNAGYSNVSDTVKKLYESSLNETQSILDNQIKQLSDYQSEFNDLVDKGYIKKFSTEWYDGLKTINESKKAISETNSAIVDFKNQIDDIQITKIQYLIDQFDRAVSKLESRVSLMKARDEKIPESMYQEQINTNNATVTQNMNQRKLLQKKQSVYDVTSTEYKDIAEQISKLDDETYNLLETNEKLKDSIFELRFAPLDEAIKKYDKLSDEIGNFYDLLNEDAFIDKQGKLTADGISGLALLQQQLAINKSAIADQTTGLNKLWESYQNNVISLDEYNEKSETYRDGLQQNAKANVELGNSIIDLYKNQMKAENDALQENIDKRKKALEAKETFYQFDRKIKSQSKDVNVLKAQIAAMEGVKLFARVLFNCGDTPIILIRYNGTGNGKRECGMSL